MDMLKRIFPFSFLEKKDVVTLVVYILLHLAVGVVAGVLIGLLSHLPLVGWLIALVGSLVDLYVLVGIVLSVLDFMNVLK